MINIFKLLKLLNLIKMKTNLETKKIIFSIENGNKAILSSILNGYKDIINGNNTILLTIKNGNNAILSGLSENKAILEKIENDNNDMKFILLEILEELKELNGKKKNINENEKIKNKFTRQIFFNKMEQKKNNFINPDYQNLEKQPSDSSSNKSKKEEKVPQDNKKSKSGSEDDSNYNIREKIFRLQNKNLIMSDTKKI